MVQCCCPGCCAHPRLLPGHMTSGWLPAAQRWEPPCGCCCCVTAAGACPAVPKRLLYLLTVRLLRRKLCADVREQLLWLLLVLAHDSLSRRTCSTHPVASGFRPLNPVHGLKPMASTTQVAAAHSPLTAEMGYVFQRVILVLPCLHLLTRP